MNSQDNALVEIALALAMVFFSIMVLAMISMSVPNSHTELKILKNYAALDLRSSSPTDKLHSSTKFVTEINPTEVILYFGGKFFDADLKQIFENSIQHKSVKYLAVDPKLSTAEAVKIRKKFMSASLAVTLLNDEWINILKESSR